MCEDFPCCGHDICPSYSPSGEQLDMKCTCGASVPLGSRSSLCPSCLDDIPEYLDSYYEYPEEDFDEAFPEEDIDPDHQDAMERGVAYDLERDNDYLDSNHPIDNGD